jgi:drug/metabolite transporter (DMT)-like permease
MDDALPASAATSARFLLASLVLSPFIFQLRKELIGMSLVAGCFTATGYIAQSLALVDTSPATVSFLGAATVIWCPFLEWLVDKKPMGINERPQTWMAVMLCILGVGILELCGGGIETAQVGIGMGDCLAVLQAIAFGTGLFMSEKMMKQHSDQALPITAVLVATTSLASMVWALVDGWMYNTPGWETMTLPNLLLEPSMREVAIAVIWTGLLSTSLNFFLEVYSLQKVPSGEASVILATEPLWAAAFASIILGESFDWNEYVGGILIVSACLVNCMNASDFQGIIPGVFTDKELKEAAEEIL